jgi:hypothetical protein
MNQSRIQSFVLTAALLASLTACGGGDDDSSSPTPAPAPAPVAPTFGNCFEVVAGIAYTMGGDFESNVLMVEEAFDGTVRTGARDSSKTTGERLSASYWSQDSSGIRFWGDMLYENDAASEKDVFSAGFLLPLSLQAGQLATLNYTRTTHYLTGNQAGQTSTQTIQQTWTFEGFETMTLGGKTFENVCRVKVAEPADTEFGPSTQWYARGFGLIRIQNTNGAGQVVEESSLETITAQPLQW